jgi:hypothetical protein
MLGGTENIQTRTSLRAFDLLAYAQMSFLTGFVFIAFCNHRVFTPSLMPRSALRLLSRLSDPYRIMRP